MEQTEDTHQSLCVILVTLFESTNNTSKMKLLSPLFVLLASTSVVQGQGADYSEYGDYQDYQEYADDYGQQDNLYADYAQRQQVKAAGGGG